MAQIVTITNPLTGQPAQVDQLEHTAQQIDDAIARALPGGGIDTLLAGKAPAGYGLGSVGVTSLLDANTAKKNGWYIGGGENAVNFPSYNHKYGELFVLARNTTIEQFSIYQGTICVRYSTDGGTTWSKWEYVNPPMVLGVEYRTTERYQGKPVYVMVVDGLSSAAGEWKQVSGFGSNVSEVVRYTATGVESTYSEIVPIPSTIGDGYKVEGGVVKTVKNNIYIRYKCNNRGLSNVKFTLYYTKTTD